MNLLAHIAIYFNLLRKDERGVIAIIAAVVVIPLVLSTGMAVDGARAYLLKQKLQFAVDAAGLAVGATQGGTAELEAVMLQYFNANFNEGEATPILEIDGTQITVSTEANIDTSFMRLISIDSLSVSAIATIERETTALEVALVLDNTGSMQFGGRIDQLISSSNSLISILFGSETEPELLRVALIPFVATVNIGVENERFTQVPDQANEYPPTVDSEWKGCVEARPFPNDVRDIFIEGEDLVGEWPQYFWEAETRFAPQSEQVETLFGFPPGGLDQLPSFCQNRWWQPQFSDFPLPDITLRPTGRRTETPPFGDNGSFRELDILPNATQGPNKACPQELTPLTNNRAKLIDDINRMRPWEGNGTMAHLGAAWGYRVLSNAAPFAEGVPFDEDGINKVMIILTDGRNLLSSEQPDSAFLRNNGVRRQCSDTNPKYTSHYSAYGYASENRLGLPGTPATETNDIEAALNERLLSVCENIKEDGITIYTITFQLDDDATQDIFRTCATTPEHYFDAATNDTLDSVFANIGAALRRLHISS